ncbi:hypothetical protein ACFQWB_00370 [Paenibacillus thermoaerophilus]|uniref:Activator of Hsp90 ATPase homolog 1-like protein n=1 Tax=Paenibacillus thermoaerophilus TaxID=1215385 RepID=A0ABW2UZH3_9BACL|nr:hypothetical protein [Paenibacillus thermoaerophilus]TMV15855.1 hypothetical protein FE781_09690 [Paenibacillus thermoaerophilus]
MAAELNIWEASMKREPGEGYVGRVIFEVKGHAKPYEMTLYSEDGRDWEYNLLFAREPGKESDIAWVEEEIERNDDWFDALVDAACEKLEE